MARRGPPDPLAGAPLRFVPNSLQLSSIRAKGLRRPKLRADLRVSAQMTDGKTSYIIKIPGINSYNRFGDLEYQILQQCDGSRTAEDVAAVISARLPDLALSESHVIDFLDSVELEMWEQSSKEQNQALLERIHQEHKRRIDHSSLFNIRFKPWNPNKLITTLGPYLGWTFTRGFVMVSVGLFLIALHVIVANWTTIVDDTEALYSFQARSLVNICAFWVLLLSIEAIHEFAHALACKHFGGEVCEAGFSLVYFTPSIYMDTTDMVLFHRRQRLWVIFAGIWIELVICGISTLLWYATLPGTFVNDVSYKMLLLSGLDTILWNLNPLIQADGYYALADYLEVDNLSESSREFVGLRLRKFVLREKLDLPLVSRRLTRIYWSYGLGSIVYDISIAALILLFARNVLTTQFGDWGELFGVVLAYLILRNRLAGAWGGIRAWLERRRKEQMAWKLSRAQQATLAGIAFLLFIPPLPYKVASDFVLEPQKRASLRTKVAGKVSQVLAREGDQVQSGQLLGVLENPEIKANSGVLVQQLLLARSDLRTTEFLSDTQRSAQASLEQSRLQSELAVALERQDGLRMVAPFEGTVTTANLDQKAGEFLPAGDEFCQVVDRTTVRARVLVRDWDLAEVKPGASVELKLLAYPFQTFTGKVAQILPAASLDHPVAQPEKLESMGHELTNYFALVVELPNPGGILREGMTGTAKISGKHRPLAMQAGRSIWRWFRGLVW
jgi:putative peptide zinc metalloprotease protein